MPSQALLVSRDPAVVEKMRHLLEGESMTVEVSADIQQACALLQPLRPSHQPQRRGHGGQAADGHSARYCVQVWFDLPASTTTVEARGEVDWCQDRKAGIRFTEILQMSKLNYHRWLAENLPGSPGPSVFINATKRST